MKGDKGEMFYITVKKLAKAQKVMYHSWKNHVWCVTWHCNIMRLTCTYALCYWWHHSLMKLNCEMSKTHNRYKYSTLQTSSMVMRENIVLQRLTHFFSLQIGLKGFYKRCTIQADCILCLLHTYTQISHIHRSFLQSFYDSDDNSIPQYELPAALITTLIIGSNCWSLR